MAKLWKKRLSIVPIRTALLLQNAGFRGGPCQEAGKLVNSLDIWSSIGYTNAYQSPAGD